MAKGRRSGFTLNEMMITTCIVGLLSALAVPNVQQSIATARSNSCLNNLRKIETAKDQYALDLNVNQGITPSDSNLDPYIRGGIQLAKQCPLKGEIAINPIGIYPSCSIASHSLQGSLHASLASGGNSTAVTGTASTLTEVVPGGSAEETPTPVESPLTPNLPMIETPLLSASTNTSTSTRGQGSVGRGQGSGVRGRQRDRDPLVSTVSTTPAIQKFVFDPLTMRNSGLRYNRRTGEYVSAITDQQTGEVLYIFKAVLPNRSRSDLQAAYEAQITVKQPL